MTREEAIRRIKTWNLDSDDREVLAVVIPELKESEDERMLREIKRYIKEQGDKPTGLPNGTVAVSDMIAWLEKQKECLTDISKTSKSEDERIIKLIRSLLENARNVQSNTSLYKQYDDALAWLEKQKDSVSNAKYIEDVAHAFEDGRKKGIEEKQKEQKPALTPERLRPKFAVGDTICHPMYCDHTVRELYVRCNDPVYVCVNEEGLESHISFSEQDEWERKEQNPISFSEPYNPDDYEVVIEGNATILRRKERKPAEWSYPYGVNETADRLVSLAECLEMDGDCFFNECSGTEWGKFLRELARKQIGCKPEWSEEDEEALDMCIDAIPKAWKTKSGILLTNWLKEHLRPSWKPTEEQLNYLAKAIMTLGEEGDCKTAGVLSEIRNGLKCSFPDWKVSQDYPKEGCNVSLNGEVKKIQEWSEKDEVAMRITMDWLIEYRDRHANLEETKDEIDYCIDWLKSLPLNLKKKNEDVAKLCSNEWSEEDEKMFDAFMHKLEVCDLLTNKEVMWAKLRFKSLRTQPKPAWSEEDEKIAKEIEEELWYPGDFPDYPSKEESELYDDCQRRLDWFKNKLKSLRSQPKQEWSEEDRRNIERLIEILPKCIFRHPFILERDECRDLGVWLRNLLYYPQKLEGWKPSESGGGSRRMEQL